MTKEEIASSRESLQQEIDGMDTVLSSKEYSTAAAPQRSAFRQRRRLLKQQLHATRQMSAGLTKYEAAQADAAKVTFDLSIKAAPEKEADRETQPES